MKNKLFKIILPLLFIIVFVNINICLAEGPPLPTIKSTLEGMGRFSGYETGVDETTAASMAGLVVNVFLSLLGIIFICFILYAGYNWMTASGDEEKVNKAKETITRAIIGIIIIIGAYAIWAFIQAKLFT